MKKSLDLLTLMDFLDGLPEGETVFDSGMDESSTNYLQNGIRILTLAREKIARYGKLLKSYEHIALQLSYKSMPESNCKWQSYFMKVMKRYMNKQMMSILEKEFPVAEGISFFYELIGEYRDNVTISYPKEEQTFVLGLSKFVRGYMRANGFVHSFSRKGNPYDNACIESLHSVMKKEERYLHTYQDFEECRKAFFEYIESWYNRQRIHSALGYKTPQQVEGEAIQTA